MNKNNDNFGHTIPELRETIVRYGTKLSKKPPYILLGQYNSKEVGPTMGILAAADNEFHAHFLCKEIRKNGYCDIQRTEYFPDESKRQFSIKKYMIQMRERMEKVSSLKE
jgi:hypothetical protein